MDLDYNHVNSLADLFRKMYDGITKAYVKQDYIRYSLKTRACLVGAEYALRVVFQLVYTKGFGGNDLIEHVERELHQMEELFLEASPARKQERFTSMSVYAAMIRHLKRLTSHPEPIYAGKPLNPVLGLVYQRAEEELHQYGRVKDCYYCRRLDRYVSQDEISIVAALEAVLNTLEEEPEVLDALNFIYDTYDVNYINMITLHRYIEMIKEYI
jgi:hypothetical protein